jgi:nitroreductase
MENHNEGMVMLGGVSQFSSEKVSEEHLIKLLSAVNRVPSAANAQPWEIIVTETEEGRRKVLHTLLDAQFRPLETAPGEKHWLYNAAVILILSMDKMRAKAKFGISGVQRFGLLDIGAAGQSILTTGLSLGIQGMMVREFNYRELAKAFGLPSHVEPVLIFGMGYSTKTPVPRPTLSVDDYVHYESWNGSRTKD